MARHQETGADATVVTVECDSPLEYGVVLTDKGGMICGFNEKPPWSQVNANRINTGIYVLNASVIDLIPPGACDFSGELFPKMLQSGRRLAEYAADGYWCDVGSVESYYKCCMDALDGKLRAFCPELESTVRRKGADDAPFCGNTYVPDDLKVGEHVKIGPNTILGSGVEIGSNSEVAGSILHDGVKIADGSRIEGAILCENALIGSRCTVSGGCVIGSGAVLADGSFLPQNARLSAGSGASAAVEKKEHIPYFTGEEELCRGEKGIFLGDPQKVPFAHTGEKECAVIGMAITDAVGRSGRIGVMYDGGPYARFFAASLLTGLERGDAFVYDFGEGYEHLAKYLAVFFGTDCFVFVRTEDDGIYASLCNRNALAPSRDFERHLQASYRFFSENDGAQSRAGADAKPERLPRYHERIEKAETYYFCELIDNAKAYLGPNLFDGMRAAFLYEDENASVPRAFGLLKRVFLELGGTVTDENDAQEKSAVIVRCSPTRGAALSQSNYTLDKYHLTAALIERERRDGKASFAFPYTSPAQYAGILGKDADVLLYPTYSGKRFSIPRELLRSRYFLTDDVLLCARALSLVRAERENLSELYFSVPAFSFQEKTVTLPEGVKKTLVIKKLAPRGDGTSLSQDGYEGIRISYPEGKVTVVPGKSQYFKIYSEAVNTEAAQALCEKAENDILDAVEQNGTSD